MKYLILVMLVGCASNSAALKIKAAEQENARQDQEVRNLEKQADQLAASIKTNQSKASP